MALVKKLLIGFVTGAGTAYFLDPEHGPRRRKALGENVAGILGQQGTNGGALAARRVQEALTAPLEPGTRLLSGAAGALAWLVGSRFRGARCYRMGTLGLLLLYRAIANAPARVKTRVGKVSGARTSTPRRAARKLETDKTAH
jgi:hypothetical protein